MDETLLRKIHFAGAKLLRDCPPPPRSADGWQPFNPESLKAAMSVEEHRWFWRPKQVKFVLLAESHVYTDADDLKCKIIYDELDSSIHKAPRNLSDLFIALDMEPTRYSIEFQNKRIQVPMNTGDSVT